MLKSIDVLNAGFQGLIMPDTNFKQYAGLKNFSLGYALPAPAWTAPIDIFKTYIMDILENDLALITTADDIPLSAEPERIHLLNSLVATKASGRS